MMRKVEAKRHSSNNLVRRQGLREIKQSFFDCLRRRMYGTGLFQCVSAHNCVGADNRSSHEYSQPCQ